MAYPMGEANKGALRLDFDRRLMLQFRGSTITSDARVHASNRSDSGVRPITTRFGLEMGAYVSADEALKLPDLA